MRAIIFCKTREMTMALQEWIKETPELVILNPNRLVGANAPAEKGGWYKVMGWMMYHFIHTPFSIYMSLSV